MEQAYVDADGHIMEHEQELNNHIEQDFSDRGYMNFRQMMPSLDSFHTPRKGFRSAQGTFDRTVGPERWLEFLNKTGLEYTVLYPTAGLAYGQIAFPDWAAAYARAYNNWMAERYLQASPRFRSRTSAAQWQACSCRPCSTRRTR